VDSSREITVARDGSGDVSSIAEALVSPTGPTRIVAWPGRYDESVVVDRDVDLVAPHGEAVIVAKNGPAVTWNARGGSLQGFQVLGTSGSSAILLDRDTRPTLRDMTVYVFHGAGIQLEEGADPRVYDCRVRDGIVDIGLEIEDSSKGPNAGVAVLKGARGSFEGCDLEYERAINVRADADPSFRRCRIAPYNADAISITMDPGAKASFSGCEIEGNDWYGGSVAQGANLTLDDCRIAHCYVGFSFMSGAVGTLRECEFGLGVRSGVILHRDSNVVIERCKANGVNFAAFIVDREARGRIYECHTSGSRRAGLIISPKALTELSNNQFTDGTLRRRRPLRGV
jgi:Right handed beta helix region